MEQPSSLPEWTAAVVTELGLDVDVDLKLLLDLARDAAHAVERPAAPITTYLLGLAVATRAGGDPISPDDVQALSDQLSGLAQRWATERA